MLLIVTCHQTCRIPRESNKAKVRKLSPSTEKVVLNGRVNVSQVQASLLSVKNTHTTRSVYQAVPCFSLKFLTITLPSFFWIVPSPAVYAPSHFSFLCPWNLFNCRSFLFFYFIYFLNFSIFGCVGSSLLRAGFLQLGRAGATLCCGAQALGAQAQQLWLKGSRERAQ